MAAFRLKVIFLQCGMNPHRENPQMSQPQPQQISGQRTQWVTCGAFSAVMCKHHCLCCSGFGPRSSLSASPNLESSTQSCVQLHVSNPVITGPSAPSKTIIGTSCLFVLSFPLPICTMTNLTFANASLDLQQSFFFVTSGDNLVQITFVQNLEPEKRGALSSMATLSQISHDSTGHGVWLGMSQTGGPAVQRAKQQTWLKKHEIDDQTNRQAHGHA